MRSYDYAYIYIRMLINKKHECMPIVNQWAGKLTLHINYNINKMQTTHLIVAAGDGDYIHIHVRSQQMSVACAFVLDSHSENRTEELSVFSLNFLSDFLFVFVYFLTESKEDEKLIITK